MFSSNATQVSSVANYIENVFSTYLYTGNGSTQTITNGIDLSTKGGLVWTKMRDGGYDHQLVDTARGVTKIIASNLTNIQSTDATSLTAFNTTGYTLGIYDRFNGSAYNYASWTFRKQPKFFDIVTYTGNGVARTIAHNLGSVPGCIMVKRLSSSANNWAVYHRSLGNATNISLNLTTAATSNPYNWNSTTPTSTEFSLGAENIVNDNGSTFVAYLFAHDAGGFGLTGTDNVISCGSYSGTGALNTITLGYEPQWIMVKNASAASNWVIIDNMRGFPAYSTIGGATLFPNTSDAENSGGSERFSPTATGFQVWSNATLNNASGNTYIYIAIRRGPMKVPTSGTSVFSPITYTGDGTTARDFTNFGMLPDFVMLKQRNGTEPNHVIDRLRGGGNYLVSSATQAESAYPVLSFDSMNGVNDLDSYFNASGATWVFEAFRRAPNFFDVVCYTGTGSTTTFNHNLGAVPELMIFKQRSGIGYWPVYDSTSGPTKITVLNAIGGSSVSSTAFNNTAPTSTVFTVGTLAQINTSAQKYVAYLFASCPGVSKVGSYIGNGSTQTINCGFAGGARFVLIKCISGSTGWYVYDTARGMTISTDPFLWLQSTDAETDAPGSVTTVTTGFAVDYNVEPGVNLSGYTYIFLAIA